MTNNIKSTLKNFTNSQYAVVSSALQFTTVPNIPKTPEPMIPPLPIEGPVFSLPISIYIIYIIYRYIKFTIYYIPYCALYVYGYRYCYLNERPGIDANTRNQDRILRDQQEKRVFQKNAKTGIGESNHPRVIHKRINRRIYLHIFAAEYTNADLRRLFCHKDVYSRQHL